MPVDELEAPAAADQPRAKARQPSFESPARRRVTIDISAGAVGKIVVGLIALGLISGFMDRMRDVFVWILAATFLAVALNPLVTRLEPRIGRRPAATVVFVGFLILLVAVFAAFVAPFVTQVDQLSTALPQAITDAKHNSTRQGPRRPVSPGEPGKAAPRHPAERRLRRRGHGARRRSRRVDSLLPDALPALRVPRHRRTSSLSQIPPERRPRVVAAAQHMNRTIGGYVAGTS